MLQKLLLFLISATIPVFIGCDQANKKSGTEKAISYLIKKYPQLSMGSGEQSDYYRLIRTIIVGDKNIELQLRSSPDTLDDPQKIIVIINSKKEAYAIPFFSNTHHDFWNFQFDSVLTSIKRTNTTFKKELEDCLERLSLNDTSGTAGIIINELFFSLLHCKRITEGDSIFLNAPTLVDISTLKEEEIDSCTIRLHKNWLAITTEFHPKDYLINYNAYWDDINNRIYQLTFTGFNQRQKISFSIKTYRQDCILHLMYL